MKLGVNNLAHEAEMQYVHGSWQSRSSSWAPLSSDIWFIYNHLNTTTALLTFVIDKVYQNMLLTIARGSLQKPIALFSENGHFTIDVLAGIRDLEDKIAQMRFLTAIMG
ncbi:hypothetical protein ACMFMG_002626 [Clarireedia jacksonii]